MKAEQLRKSILQLAIQGKLVKQDQNDEPASVLLERIRAEKQRLIKEGKIKKDKGDSIIFKGDDNCHYEKIGAEVKNIEDEIYFDLPDGWEYIRLSQIAYLGSGFTPSPSELSTNGNIPYFKVSDMNTIGNEKYISITQQYYIGDKTKKVFPKNTIIFPKNGGAVFTNKKRILLQDSIVDLNTGAFIPYGLIDVEYAYILFSTIDFREHYKGTALPTINTEFMNKLIFGLPPIAEQKRIVKAIEQLSPYIQEYDNLEQQTTKLDSEIYDKLKKSILQYAIQGKLVEQDENDEPASVLLERIRAEKKAQLGKKYVESYIYKGDDNCYYEKVGKNEPVLVEDLPFDIPDTWSWTRLKDIVYNHGQKTPTSDFSYIDIGSIDNKRQKLSSVENIITADKAPSRARKIIKFGDILYSTVRPYLHNMCIVDKDFSCEPIASTGFAVLSCEKGIYNQFLFYYMLSPIFDLYANSTENAKGVAYPAINDDRLYKAIIPIPPQSEQERICLRIKEVLNHIEKDES